jgi:hypothetical protein
VGSLLPLQITELVSIGKCGKHVSYEREGAFCYQFLAAEATCMYINKPHIFAEAADTDFFQFKEQIPFEFKIKYQRFNVK